MSCDAPITTEEIANYLKSSAGIIVTFYKVPSPKFSKVNAWTYDGERYYYSSRPVIYNSLNQQYRWDNTYNRQDTSPITHLLDIFSQEGYTQLSPTSTFEILKKRGNPICARDHALQIFDEQVAGLLTIGGPGPDKYGILYSYLFDFVSRRIRPFIPPRQLTPDEFAEAEISNIRNQLYRLWSPKENGPPVTILPGVGNPNLPATPGTFSFQSLPLDIRRSQFYTRPELYPVLQQLSRSSRTVSKLTPDLHEKLCTSPITRGEMARYLTSRYNVRLDFYTPTNAAPQIPKPVTWFPSPLFGKAYLRYTRESPRSDRPYRYYTVTLRYTYYDEENETILHTKPDHSIREEETVLPNIVQKFETIDDAINELKVLGFTLIDPIDLLYLYRQRTLCSPNYYIGRVLQEFDKIVTGLYQLGTIYDVDDYEDRRDDLMDFLQQLGNAIDYDEIEFLVEPEDYNETRIYEYRDALERYLTSNMDNNSHPADSEPLPH